MCQDFAGSASRKNLIRLANEKTQFLPSRDAWNGADHQNVRRRGPKVGRSPWERHAVRKSVEGFGERMTGRYRRFHGLLKIIHAIRELVRRLLIPDARALWASRPTTTDTRIMI